MPYCRVFRSLGASPDSSLAEIAVSWPSSRGRRQMSVGFQPLPTPTMLSGAPAALLSYCQRRGRAAMCFAAADLPGRRRAPPQQQLLGLGAGVGVGVGGGGSRSVEEVLAAERGLSCTWKPLGVVAGGAMVSGGAGVGGEGAKTEVDAVSAMSSLYV